MRGFLAIPAAGLTIAVAACGSSSSSSTTSTSSSAPGGSSTTTVTSTTASNLKSFNVTVTGTTPSQTELDATKGDTIRLTFTTDKDEEVHLHGFDIHFDCKAGVPLTQTFTADMTGQFEYELEASSTHLGNLVVNP